MKSKIVYTLFGPTLVLIAVNMYFIFEILVEGVKVDSLQYYGQVVNVKEVEIGKITLAEGISIGKRLGPSKKRSEYKLGDLTKMYEALDEGDFIAFKF